MSKEILLNNLKRAQEEIELKKGDMEYAKMRQKYHFMAEQGWINDPNGLIYFRDKYHFFYQYNPFDAHWGMMYWGHAISDDMINWEYMPVALAPSETYDNCQEGGCFSGSAIAHDDKLYLVYTGTTKCDGKIVQTQCLAYSDDGVHFEKFDGNPIISEPPEGFDKTDFRDPKIWEYNNKFYIVCGGKRNNLACALLYSSDNLVDWKFVNILAESRGEFGSMWECPDFYSIGDKYVLTFSPIGLHERKSLYMVGDMNYDTGKFTYTTIGEMDWGFDYYAPQSFLDKQGRRVVVSWANGWDWMPWWKDWGPSYKEGWCGFFNLPREVIICDDNTLKFKPIEELKNIRTGEYSEYNICVGSDASEIKTSNGISFEIDIKIDLKQTTANKFSLNLRCNEMYRTIISFDLEKQMMSVDRNEADGWSRGETKSPLLLVNKDSMDIHVFVDQSSIEVFTDDYKTNHSCNVFASDEQNKNYIIASNGEVSISHITTWGLA